MKCWQCGAAMDGEERKVGFRTQCEGCGSWQHCCVNCTHYQPSAPNSCLMPGTDWVRDRESMNFCDAFSLRGTQLKKGDPQEAARRLFGEEKEPPLPPEDPFSQLFKEDDS